MTSDEMQKLTELLAQKLSPGATAPLSFPGTNFAAPPSFGPTAFAAPGNAQPEGLLVGVTVQTPNGDCPGYLFLGRGAPSNPAAAIMQLAQPGWPIRIFNGASGWQGRSYGGKRRW